MNIWDEKASSYARYSSKLNEVMQIAFDFCAKNEVSFKDKNIVDVGGGSGVWSLHLAKSANNVLVLDASFKMLDLLKKDAKSLNLTNIQTAHTEFKSFDKSGFDIAFLSMCPALNDEEDFKHFLSLAQEKVYINFANTRKSTFLDPIFTHFKAKKRDFGQNDLECFLQSKNINYKKITHKEIRIKKRDFNQSLACAAWHLKIGQIAFDEDELKSLIPSCGVSEEITSVIKILVIK